MAIEPFRWPLTDEFLDRAADLDRLERWWEAADRQPLALVGRRRVGKSWLFRRFAHGKRAIVLVAEQVPAGTQLTRFAAALEPLVGVRPELPDTAALFRVLFRAARDTKLLAVIDELPWLLGASAAETGATLSAVQAVMEEERDESQLKLLLCGSHVSTMDALFGERNPMHGRLVRHELRPVAFDEARAFLPGLTPIEAFERYAIAGGMPLYLSRVARGSLRQSVCREILHRDGPLWNEGRSILEQELREPRVYLGILEQLASGEKELNEIAQPLRMPGAKVSKYLSTLQELRIVTRRTPLSAPPGFRGGHWRLEDPFFRFWFRFVFPYQADLESGLRARDLYDGEVVPKLADHVAPVFEDWCRAWVRAHRGARATQVGCWWGNAANVHRRAGSRSSEEIDIVGVHRSRVTLVGECKWTTRPLGPDIVQHLEDFKIPALRDAGCRVANSVRIVLFSKAGYTAALRRLAEDRGGIELIDVAAALGAATGSP